VTAERRVGAAASVVLAGRLLLEADDWCIETELIVGLGGTVDFLLLFLFAGETVGVAFAFALALGFCFVVDAL
jgi:hypothetical protein